MPPAVVSLMGRSCTAFMPAEAAQSTNERKSPKSPMPKLPAERSENTGITTPAPRQGARAMRGASSLAMTVAPASGESGRKRRLSPSSQRINSGRRSSVNTYLYSNPAAAVFRSSAKENS